MNLALAPEMQVSSSSFEGIPDMAVAVQNLGGRRSKPHPTQVQKCPRCDSLNTKFCYYNNYNLSQPRYFCKNCRRYWTKGGALRNVPVGGGCRKNKRSNKRNSDKRPAASSAPPTSAADNQAGGGASVASSSSSLVNGSDRSSIGFESDCNNTTTSTTTTNTGGATGTPAGVSSGQLFDGMNPINPPPPSLDPQARGALLNSGNNLSSILDPSAYENAQFSCMDPVISSTPDWSRGLSMPWKQQQTLTSLLTDGIRTSLDGFLSQPPPLLEDINSLAEAATRSVFGVKTSAATVPWPSLQEDDNIKAQSLQGLEWQTANGNSSSDAGLLEIQSDLGPWGAGSWPDLGNYGPGSSLP